MSKPLTQSRSVLGLILCSLVFTGGGLSGQDRPLTPAERDQLMQEAIQAYDTWQPVRAAAQALDQAIRNAELQAREAQDGSAAGSAPGAQVDSVRVGPFHIYGDPLHLDRAAQQVANEWNRFSKITQGPPPFWVQGARLGYSRSSSLRFNSFFDGWVVIGYDNASANAAMVQGSLRKVLAGPISDDRFLEWAGNRGLSPVEYPRQVVRSLLESDSPLAAECFQDRNIESCSLLLDLDYIEPGVEREAWVRAVYPTPRMRYELVRGRQIFWSGAFGMQRWEDCYGSLQDIPEEIAAERDLACTQVAANADPHQSLPVGDEARASLVRLALDLGGGTPALERIELLPSDASPRQAIEAAAERPAEEVVALWLESLSAADTTQGRFPGKSGIFWASCFAAFALRSTRWRLG